MNIFKRFFKKQGKKSTEQDSFLKQRCYELSFLLGQYFSCITEIEELLLHNEVDTAKKLASRIIKQTHGDLYNLISKPQEDTEENGIHFDNEFTQLPILVESNTKPIIIKFTSTKDLLSHPWISNIRNGLEDKKFYRFSVSKKQRALVAEFEEGNYSFILGYLKYPDLLNLPKFDGKLSKK